MPIKKNYVVVYFPVFRKEREVEMNTKTPIQAMVFDFDGTLADTRSSIIQCLWELLNHFNIPIPPHFSLESLFTRTFDEVLQSIPGVEMDQIPELVDYHNHRYSEIARRKAQLFPGVLKTLSVLSHSSLSLAIATNENREILDELIAGFNIESFFHLTVCHDEVLRPKPFPDMAKRIMREFDVPSEKTLVIGDSVLDIEMGKRARCQTCAVTYGAQSKRRLKSRSPRWMVGNFTEIVNFLDPAREYEAFG